MKDAYTSIKIMNATINLLKEREDPSSITAREIVAMADVNLAMINYCYQSKEKLVYQAVDKIISEEFSRNYANLDKTKKPLEQLRHLLYLICDKVYQYKKITSLSIPYELLQKEISTPNMVLPLVLEHINGAKSDQECKIITYQLITFLQVTFLQAENFYNYSGINIEDQKQRHQLIDMELALLLDK